MSAITIQQMADRVAELLQERLRAKGDGLAARVKHSARKLPRKVRVAADNLADAAAKAQNPKLLVQLDYAKIADDYDICLKHLGPLDRKDRRKGVILGLTTSVFFILLVVAGLFLAVLRWRDFL